MSASEPEMVSLAFLITHSHQQQATGSVPLMYNAPGRLKTRRKGGHLVAQVQYRQGDLLFILQEAQPAVDLTVRPGLVILAGEATGHAHRLTTGTILEAPDGMLYLDLVEPTRVVHEEHDALTLGPGWWLVVRQREYTPSASRLVRD
jgi:hypothetical protein